MWQVLRYRLLRIAARQSVREFKPEVIHAHDLIPLPLAISAAGPQTKVVYDSHELETHRNGLRWFGRQIVALVERRAIAEVDAVITVSPGIAKYLAQRYGLADPEVIFNAPRWPHEGQAKAIGGGLRERLRLAPSTPLIVYVGKLTFNRGLESVVHALPLFPEAHFAMVGPSVPKTVAAVRALAAQLDLSGRVHVVDPVPPEEVIRFVASADVGIIPTHDACLSYRYSMPNKLFEMTFAGLPICASDLPYQRKFLEEAGNGIIMDEESTADVARAMREAWNRREQLRPSPEQLERLAEKYAWSAQKAKLLALYARLLSHVDVGSGMAARSHA
jgi:glycosyltransferase involved in cell wall biosynthesis